MPDRPLVLVVEDDPALRPLLAEILGEEGYAVAAWTGPADPPAVAALSPDLVLTELIFAGGPTGRGFVRGLRADPATAAVPVLVVTGSAWAAGPEQAAALERLGCVAVAKPFDLDELLSAVASGAVHWADVGHRAGWPPRGAGPTLGRLPAAVRTRRTVPPDPAPAPSAPPGRRRARARWRG